MAVSRPIAKPRPRRFATATASLLLLILVAAGCSSDGFPESYADQVDDETGLSNVEFNWMQGCEVAVTESNLAEDANGVCRCSYSEISGTDGIPFEDFVELNSALRGDPTTLSSGDSSPAEIRLVEIVRDCIAG